MCAVQIGASVLPFVSSTDLVCFWDVTESGNWTRDNETGRRYAELCIDYMARAANPALLGSIVKAMIASGHYGGIEVGFMAAIADRATTS